MVDKKSSIGFRPEYHPVNFDISYLPDEGARCGGVFWEAQGQLDSNKKVNNNYVTAINFDFGCSWQFVNAAGPYPTNMVRGGVDSDGTVIFIGRAFHEGDMVPAKVMPDKNAAYICYGGEEIFKEDFEVLRSGDFVWEFATAGTLPEGAVTCGQTADGEQLFIGRALHQGTQTPGKIQPSHGCLYIPFDGLEVSIAEYEVLCLK